MHQGTRSFTPARSVATLAMLGAMLLGATDLRAEVPAETWGRETLPANYSPHWAWVDDVSFFHMPDGRAYLVDADSGRFLGTLSTGALFMHLNLPRSRPEIYAATTFYSRLNRGTRTDAIEIFDRQNLEPIGEIVIPAKRSTGMPNLAYATLTGDDRFMAVFNMTPAQSVSIADMVGRKFVEEVALPGCGMIYPAGPRRLASLCGDGTLLTVTLGEDGRESARASSKAFFDADKDPVTEKAVRLGDFLYFVSVDSVVHPVNVAGTELRFDPTWSFLTEEDSKASWRVGGMQSLAAHEKDGRLYALMHQGDPGTRKDPGTEVWVFDVSSQKRIARIVLKSPATSVQVTRDDEPLLLTAFLYEPALQVYDARSGAHLRTISQLGETPTLIQTN
jgi:methylamine dehydrogenase heavy chain